MTKKHFDALAAALRHQQPMFNDAAVAQWECDVDSIAGVCARFNPNFDRARFLAACGVEDK